MMRILMDVDGVLADFTGGCSKVLGRELTPKRWEFIEELPPEERNTLEIRLREAGFWQGLEVIPGAQKGVKALKAAGHEIVYVTAPWSSAPTWGYQRAAWLARRFKATRKDIVITPRKELIEGDCIIDDKPANVDAWLAEHWHRGPIYGGLYAQPYNEGILDWPNISYRFTWDNIPGVLL